MISLTNKTLKVIDFKVTTREELWTEIYASALEVGFSMDRASTETDRAVTLIFDEIGPKREAELREFHQVHRLRPRVISNRFKAAKQN